MTLQTTLIKPAFPLQRIADNLSAVWRDDMRCSTDPNDKFPPLSVLQSAVQSDATDGKYFAIVCVDTDTNTVAGVMVAKRSGQIQWWTSRTSVDDADTLAIQEVMCSVAKKHMSTTPWGRVSNSEMRAKALRGEFALLDDLSAPTPSEVEVEGHMMPVPPGLFPASINYPPGEIITYTGS